MKLRANGEEEEEEGNCARIFALERERKGKKGGIKEKRDANYSDDERRFDPFFSLDCLSFSRTLSLARGRAASYSKQERERESE